MALFKKLSYTDQELIEGLRKGGREEDRCMKYLYNRRRKQSLAYVMNNHGTLEEGKDVFQSAVIVLYEQILSGKFDGRVSISTYLFSVVKNHWLRELRRTNREASGYNIPEEKEELINTPIVEIVEGNARKMLEMMMAKIKPDCRKVLNMVYFQGLSMKMIQERMGFKNEQVARNKKGKCLDYFKKLIKDKPGYWDRLNEIR